MADEYSDNMFNLTFEQECEREAEQRELERQDSEREYQEAMEEERRENERRKIEEALQAAQKTPSTASALTSVFAVDAVDGTLSDFQSKKDKKKKKSKNKPVENQEKDKKLLYRSDSAIENVKDLFAEEETDAVKKSDLRLLPSAPEPGLCGDGGKSPTDTGVVNVAASACSVLPSAPPPKEYCDHAKEKTPARQQTKPEPIAVQNNGSLPAPTEAIPTPDTAVDASTTTSTSCSKPNMRESSQSLKNKSPENSTEKSSREKTDPHPLPQPLDLSTICRPSSIESLECHPPTPHLERGSVISLESVPPQPAHAADSISQHIVMVKSASAEAMVKSQPLTSFEPLPSSPSPEDTKKNHVEKTGKNLLPKLPKTLPQDPKKFHANAPVRTGQKVEPNRRHAIFYQPDDHEQEEEEIFTDVNLFAVKPASTSPQPKPEQKTTQLNMGTAGPVLKHPEYAKKGGCTLNEQVEAKAAVCDVIKARSDKDDNSKPKISPRPRKRAREGDFTMFYEDQGKGTVDPMMLVRLVDEKPPHSGITTEGKKTAENPIVTESEVDGNPTAKSDNTSIKNTPMDGNQGTAPARGQLSKISEEEDVEDDVAILVAAAKIINNSQREKKVDGRESDEEKNKSKTILRAMKICFIDLVHRKLSQNCPVDAEIFKHLSFESEKPVSLKNTTTTPKSDAIVNDNSVVSAHGPIVRQTSKLNQSRTELWSRSGDKTVLTQTGNTAGSSTQSKSGKRKESIIEQEIRIQKNREEELHADRQKIVKHKTTPAPSSSNGKLPVQAQPETQSTTNGEVSNQMESVTKAMDNVSVTENSVYVSESPIQRDIRISKEREAELRSSRDASK